jgi:hypothetical protein
MALANGHDDTAPTEPNKLLLDGSTPTIRLAEKDWPVPLLAPKQNRVVGPAIVRVMDLLRKLVSELYAELTPEQVEQFGGEQQTKNRLFQTPLLVSRFMVAGAQGFDDLCTAVYHALTRAHPGLTRDEFDNMPVTTLELIQASGIIAQQTGLMQRPAAAAAPENPSPAPEGATATDSPTGTASSPE